jgi:hypothetical protein
VGDDITIILGVPYFVRSLFIDVILHSKAEMRNSSIIPLQNLRPIRYLPRQQEPENKVRGISFYVQHLKEVQPLSARNYPWP